MGLPQILMLVLYGLSLMINIQVHNKPRAPVNANHAFIGCLMALGLMYWGGFFSGSCGG